MTVLFTVLKVLLGVESLLVTLAGLLQMLLDQRVEPVMVQPVWLDNQDVMQ